jgi:hypothetical protein
MHAIVPPNNDDLISNWFFHCASIDEPCSRLPSRVGASCAAELDVLLVIQELHYQVSKRLNIPLADHACPACRCLFDI